MASSSAFVPFICCIYEPEQYLAGCSEPCICAFVPHFLPPLLSLLLILQNGTLDTHDPKASHLRLSFLKKRSKITEIVAAKVAKAHQFSHQTSH